MTPLSSLLHSMNGKSDRLKTVDEILDFWFSSVVRPRWFNATLEFDRQLEVLFAASYRQAAAGKLQHWEASPAGALALVILLDQVPLNIFRGQAQSFATESRARQVAANAIARGFDLQLNDEQKAFLYLPFMHSENLADQDFSVALYEQAGLKDNLKWAHNHREIVQRFGRFPHRNSILGRENRAEETEYLNSKQAYHG